MIVMEIIIHSGLMAISLHVSIVIFFYIIICHSYLSLTQHLHNLTIVSQHPNTACLYLHFRLPNLAPQTHCWPIQARQAKYYGPSTPIMSTHPAFKLDFHRS